MRTIRVRAGVPSIPLPSNLAIDTGLTVLTPETSVEVLYNRYTRRRLACGDFVEIEPEATPPAASDPPAGPLEQPTSPWGDEEES